MKNKIFKLSTIVVLVFAFGCEDYLTEEPITDFFTEEIFTTEDAVESAVTGMYINFASFEYHGSGYLNLVYPMSGKFWSSQAANIDATGLNCTPSNINLNQLWSGMYSAINACNVVIANLDASDAELNNKDFAYGQAYLLRAITYFDMVRFWGGVPIKTTPASVDDLNTSRSSKDEVYDLIISDLQQAKNLLPNVGEYNLSRPSNLVANTYLAKVYMQLAGEDGGNPSLWQSAYNELIQVYGQYALVPTYADLFDLGNENNSESMFEIQYTLQGGRRTSDAIRLFNPNGIFQNLNTFGRIRPNKEVFDQHVNQYTEEDPRVDATFYYGSYQRFNNQGNLVNQNLYPTITNNNNGYTCVKKYTDPSYNGTTTERNFYKLRYADVLLMLAEIENELNGPSNAYQYVNEVLARARNTANGVVAQPADWSGLSQDEFRIRILRERQYEMLGEGHEWFDTRRRGYEYFLEEVIENHNNQPNFGNVDYIYPISVKNMLMPIPSDEINSNQSISEADQNPGY
jgi:hypothetical protein